VRAGHSHPRTRKLESFTNPQGKHVAEERPTVQIISFHSFRGGAGKSNISANVATQFAMAGKRVGVVDADILSPGIHVLFGVDATQIKHSLNDYLWGKCEIQETAIDVTPGLRADIRGKIYLIPSSLKAGEIARVLREGYDVGLLNDGFLRLIEGLGLDMLIIDTHPGINEETLLSIAISDELIIVLRPDQQDYQGTGVAVEVARRLDVPSLHLIVNKTPSQLPLEQVKRRVELAYHCPVLAVLPHSDEMMILASEGIFSLHFPDHELTRLFSHIASAISH
jgi:MinD-like ATPase involved in chromosome partitioning or flagellar assembly